jgi:hypothetical protein
MISAIKLDAFEICHISAHDAILHRLMAQACISAWMAGRYCSGVSLALVTMHMLLGQFKTVVYWCVELFSCEQSR